MKPICVYHNADLDGKCAAAIVFHAHKGEVDLYGMDYGDPILWDRLDGRPVIMVDFGFQPFEEMVALQKKAESLIWIDHHKSALSDARAHSFVCLGLKEDNNEWAGCELAWRHFNKTESMPTAVHWLGRYDIWKHFDRADILGFQSGMKTYDTEPTSSIWPLVFKSEPEFLSETVRRGEIVQASMNAFNSDLAKKLCFTSELDGLRIIAANRGPTGSQFFKTVYDEMKHDAMVAFYLRPDWQWSVSLYSTKDGVDCSVIAKAHGGGGHKGAAGFQCDVLPFTLGGKK